MNERKASIGRIAGLHRGLGGEFELGIIDDSCVDERVEPLARDENEWRPRLRFEEAGE